MSDKIRELLNRIVPRLDAGGQNPIDPELHHCEWVLYRERERIHAEFAAALAQQPATAVREEWRYIIERVVDELDALNCAFRDQIDDEMADPEEEFDRCAATDELIEQARAMLAIAPAAPAPEAQEPFERVSILQDVPVRYAAHTSQPSAEQPDTVTELRDLMKRYFCALDRFDQEGPVSITVAAAKEAEALEKELRALLAGGEA